MSKLSHLEPHAIWVEFEKITAVPRPSKHEQKIIAYLIEFANSHSLEYKTDKAGNVVILRRASSGYENSPVVILQSHIDMVCEKNSDVTFDFMSEPIRVRIAPQGWVSAEGTTLGADCGIGMAAALALLADTTINAPAIEALFTVDEETGLTGAFNLGEDMLTGKYLINLDSEDEGEVFIGCAGGIGTTATFNYTTTPSPKNQLFFGIEINGLKGGHSGDDIDKGRANSNQLMGRLLLRLLPLGMELCDLDGGNLHNAIPREASATISMPAHGVAEMFAIFESFTAQVSDEYRISEPTLATSICEVPFIEQSIDKRTTSSLIKSLVGTPNGVLAMSTSMAGLVETSTNLASVKFTQGNTILVTTSQRSSSESGKLFAAAAVESVFALAGATVNHSEGYPGWKPNTDSALLKMTLESYQRLFGNKPKVRAIHAGLECGLFSVKYPQIEMISFGPTLRGVHSPDEMLEIASVDKFWRLLLDLLKEMK